MKVLKIKSRGMKDTTLEENIFNRIRHNWEVNKFVTNIWLRSRRKYHRLWY